MPRWSTLALLPLLVCGSLIASGLLRSIPRDPTGSPYVLRTDCRIVVADPKKLPFIHAGNPG